MKSRVLRWLGLLGLLGGFVWIASDLPSRPSDGAVGLFGISFFVALIAHGIIHARKVHATNTGAVEELASKSFKVTCSILSERLDTLIALDDQNRVALCELGSQGTVLVTRIAPIAEFEADTVTTERGGLVLVVSYRRRRYEIVFVDSVPRSGDGLDLDELERVRHMLEWWCDTLRGEHPTTPYEVATSVMLRARGTAVEATLAKAVAELEPPLPKARVVSDRERKPTPQA